MFSTRTFVRPLALTAAAGLLIALPACAAADDPATAPAPATTGAAGAPASSPSASPSTASTPAASPSSAAPSTSASPSPGRAAGNEALSAAGQLALQEVSDGTVISIESGRNGWEVHVVTADGAEQRLRTDQAGTAVASGPTDDRPGADDRGENRQFAQVEVDYRAAVDAVEGEIDGGQLSDLSLDREGNRTLWEADVSVGAERRTVQLDADTGAVLSNRIDD